MAESKDLASDSNEQTVEVDIPEGAELWVGIEQQDGFAPTVIVGGNLHGLRMLSNYCKALADSGVAGGRISLTAGDVLLEGSEADLLLVVQSEDVVAAPDPDA